jgi:hypothetical protein
LVDKSNTDDNELIDDNLSSMMISRTADDNDVLNNWNKRDIEHESIIGIPPSIALLLQLPRTDRKQLINIYDMKEVE